MSHSEGGAHNVRHLGPRKNAGGQEDNSNKEECVVVIIAKGRNVRCRRHRSSYLNY